MTIDIRETRPDEWRAATDTFRGALLFGPVSDEDWEKPFVAESWEQGHSISAWDGDICVGHAGAFDVHTMVPGGSILPTAAVTRVGVTQTHTRKGILTGIMTQLLRDSAEQGKVIASLRASEAVIYGRYGYGVAGEVWDIEIDRKRGIRVVSPVAPGSTRILHADHVLDTVMDLHSAVGLDRPGTLVRPHWMHLRYLEDAICKKSTFVIAHSDPNGNDDGWAQYSLSWGSEFGQPEGGTCTVADVWGADPAVELALWKFILDLDLIDTVRAQERPLDDVVRFALNDNRYYKSIARFDEQWVRLLDVDAALQTRTYNPAQGAVTIAVVDPIFPSNCGTWRVSSDGVEKVASAPEAADLSTTITGVSAAYLGGTAWWDLWASGSVEQRTEGAIALADTLFASHPMPRCGSFF